MIHLKDVCLYNEVLIQNKERQLKKLVSPPHQSPRFVNNNFLRTDRSLFTNKLQICFNTAVKESETTVGSVSINSHSRD